FDGSTDAGPAVVPWSPPPEPHPYRFEAEAEWPPISQTGGFFEPVEARGTCAWGGRLLAVRTTPDRPFQGTISFPVPHAGRWSVAVHVANKGPARAFLSLRPRAEAPPIATWRFQSDRADLSCTTLRAMSGPLEDHALLEISAFGEGLFLDAIALDPDEPAREAAVHD